MSKNDNVIDFDDTADLHELLALMGVGTPKVRTMPVEGQLEQCINEAATYKLVFMGRTPKARAFKAWVRGTLLPRARARASIQSVDDLRGEVRSRLASVLGPLRLVTE
jgi:prophage antirepressor-like protein